MVFQEVAKKNRRSKELVLHMVLIFATDEAAEPPRSTVLHCLAAAMWDIWLHRKSWPLFAPN